jgi:hypothetical protein
VFVDIQVEHSGIFLCELFDAYVCVCFDLFIEFSVLRYTHTFTHTHTHTHTHTDSIPLIDLLKKQKAADKPYAAICASPAVVLQTHGLLDGMCVCVCMCVCVRLSIYPCIWKQVVFVSLLLIHTLNTHPPTHIHNNI